MLIGWLQLDEWYNLLRVPKTAHDAFAIAGMAAISALTKRRHLLYVFTRELESTMTICCSIIVRLSAKAFDAEAAC